MQQSLPGRGSVQDVGTAAGASDADVEFEMIFDVLKNTRRRMVLEYLAEDPSTTRSALAEHLAARENDVSTDDLTASQRKRVYVALHQNHLPKLAEYEAVSYDSERGTVEWTERTGTFLRCLRALESADTAPEQATSRGRHHWGAVLLTGAVGVSVFAGGGPALSVLATGLLLLLIGIGWALIGPWGGR